MSKTYKVYLSTKVKPDKLKEGSGIIVIEPEDYTLTQIKAIKKKGYKVLAYLSVGSISIERSWYTKYSDCKLKRLEDWPKEHYMDLRKVKWKNFLINRAKSLKANGYDGWWLDNIDVYSEYRSSSMFTAVGQILSSIKKIGGYVMINGGSEWLDDAIDKEAKLTNFLNGYTQEEVFSLIKSYKGKGSFGKQNKKDSKYYKSILKKVIKQNVNGFLLEYTRDEELIETIKKWCKENKADHYISKDVNL